MTVRTISALIAATFAVGFVASAQAAPFIAYADTVPPATEIASGGTATIVPQLGNAPNTALLSIGVQSNEGSIWGGPNSALLLDHATGASTGVTATLSQNPSGSSVIFQPSSSTGGGASTAPGTPAYNVFNGIVDLTGVVYYPSTTGWWVDLTFTGLDPAMTYTFITSADRAGTGYEVRRTRYTISGVEGFVNDSSVGTTITNGGASTIFSTGTNFANGYIAKWTDIAPGSDGSFSVRAQADNDNRAYTFDGFMLQAVPEPSSLAVVALGAIALLRRRHG